MKVVFATPSISGPMPCFIRSLKASLPLIEKAGWKHKFVQEVGNPYISNARATMLRKALDWVPDVIVFLDYDLSWSPKTLLTLLEAEGDVVAGTYRFKTEKEEYMGSVLRNEDGTPKVCDDGTIYAKEVPGGFLKVTRIAIERFMYRYPELIYGPVFHPSIDLFNHGAYKGIWYGEDYMFCRRWIDCGGHVYLLPNLNIHHHTKEKVYKGNFHKYLKTLHREKK